MFESFGNRQWHKSNTALDLPQVTAINGDMAPMEEAHVILCQLALHLMSSHFVTGWCRNRPPINLHEEWRAKHQATKSKDPWNHQDGRIINRIEMNPACKKVSRHSEFPTFSSILRFAVLDILSLAVGWVSNPITECFFRFLGFLLGLRSDMYSECASLNSLQGRFPRGLLRWIGCQKLRTGLQAEGADAKGTPVFAYLCW